MTVRLINADCMDAMKRLIAEGVTVHSIVTDPPYGLTSVVKRFGKEGAAPAKSNGATGVYRRASAGFMGQTWDGTGIEHNVEMWRLCYDLLPPGGYLLAFGGTRTWHRIAAAIEDAGFEIRDTVAWLYGTGFPKSHDVSKGIDKMMGAEREVIGTKVYGDGHIQRSSESIGYGGSDPDADQRTITAPATPEAATWAGWGTALKPAFEPIIVARKPLIGTVAQNVLAHGTGALNIDGCRVPYADTADMDQARVPQPSFNSPTGKIYNFKTGEGRNGEVFDPSKGRWPANVIHDGSDEVEAAFAAFGERPGQQGALVGHAKKRKSPNGIFGEMPPAADCEPRGDAGTASRFFYCAKATRKDRNEGCEHLDEKPLSWSAGTKNPGSFQADGTRKASENNHPTVKPTDLMRWLCRLVTPPGGTILDPFMGSGSTGKAAIAEGFRFIGIEAEERFYRIAQARTAGGDALTRLQDGMTRLTEALDRV